MVAMAMEDMVVMDIMARGLLMLSLDMAMEVMDMAVDMVAMAMEDMVVMDIMARGLLMLSLDMAMEVMDMAMDMVAMDMVIMDMGMDTLVRRIIIFPSKSSEEIFLFVYIYD